MIVNIFNKIRLKTKLAILMMSMGYMQVVAAQDTPVQGQGEMNPHLAPDSFSEHVKYGLTQRFSQSVATAAYAATLYGGVKGYQLGEYFLATPNALQNMYHFSLIYKVPFLTRMELRIAKGLFSLFVKDLGGKRSILAMSTTAGAILGGVGIPIVAVSGMAVLEKITEITDPIYHYFYPDNLEVADAKIPVETPAPSTDAEIPAEIPTTSAFSSPLIDESAPAKEEKSVNSDQHPAPLWVSASPLIVGEMNNLLATSKAQLTANFQQLETLNSQVDAENKKLGAVNKKIDQLQQAVQKNDKKVMRGIAIAAALGNAELPSKPGKTVMNAGVAHYDGVQGLAINVTHRLESMSQMSFQGGIGASFGGKPIMRLGASYEF